MTLRPAPGMSPHLAAPLAAGAVLLALAIAVPTRAAPLAFDQPGLQADARLEVTVPGVTDGGLLPTNYTADGRDLSPPISWSAGPSRTTGYVVVVQDADAVDASLRWSVYDIAGGVTTLPRGMHNLAAPTHPLGVHQGRNDHDGFGYAGPRPAPGEPPHRYHLQVFAVDRPLRLGPGAPLARLEQAMSGHIVARGELVVTYPAPPRPASAKPTRAAAALEPPA